MDLPLTGEPLALDLINTMGGSPDGPVDHLATLDGLRRWLVSQEYRLPQPTADLTEADRLSQGLSRLDGGIVRLSDGAARVDTGVGRLSRGAGELSTGIGRLADGSKELSDKLGEGAARIPDYDGDERARRADMMSEPVRLAGQVLNRVPNYGTGFAPFFVPLALWVGAMVSYMVLRPLNPRLLAGTAPAWRIALAGWLP
ncbi:ABATE domain-containing protein, partial [Streptosporangium algeriense]